jgi:hypothetical protein
MLAAAMERRRFYVGQGAKLLTRRLQSLTLAVPSVSRIAAPEGLCRRERVFALLTPSQ